MDLSTTSEKIKEFELKLNKYVLENSRMFHNNVPVLIRGIILSGDLVPVRKLKVEAWFTYRGNSQNSSLYLLRRNKAVSLVIDCLKEFEIEATVINIKT